MIGSLTVHIFLIFSSATAAVENFDDLKPGILPSSWQTGVTGGGEVYFAVRPDNSAPSKPNVLLQSKVGDYPYCVKPSVSIENGFAEVKFRLESGTDDQAAGIIWKFKSAQNYYVARANALEENVALFFTEEGKRKSIKQTDAPVKKNKWHTLRIEFDGPRIKVLLNGKTYIELDDEHIKGPGSVGLWTKADSITAFDDFSYGKFENKKNGVKK